MIPAIPNAEARHDFQITVGTVKATDTRATGGTIERGATHANIHVTPVVWLEDEAGVEHTFEGASFGDIRVGHKLVVVHKRSSGKIIRVYNQATRTTTDSNDLIPMKSGPNNLIFGALMLTIIGMLPAIIAYTAVVSFLRENVLGRDPRSFDLWSHFPYAAILLVAFCIWLMIRLIADSHAKAKALSDLVDEAVRREELSVQGMPASHD
ncbi:hypothetical protein ACXYMP_06445 [Aliiroseovarius sp. CAU 1755]